MNSVPRFGLATPIVILLPHKADSWERDAGTRELHHIAVHADELGYDSMTCSEHVGVPSEVAAVRGGRYYDPVATFAYMAAITTRIKFLTHIVVLPYHHPLAVAKRFGTLDQFASGRLILGLGVGSLEQEFELLDAEFDNRGARYTDGIRALRVAMGQRQPSYQGQHYQFDDFIIDPCAQQQSMPFWLAGRTPLSLRRALKEAEGWAPFALSTEQLGGMLTVARDSQEWRGRETAFDVSASLDLQLDLLTKAGVEAAKGKVQALLDVGVTHFNAAFAAQSLQHHLDQMAAFQEQVVPAFA